MRVMRLCALGALATVSLQACSGDIVEPPQVEVQVISPREGEAIWQDRSIPCLVTVTPATYRDSVQWRFDGRATSCVQGKLTVSQPAAGQHTVSVTVVAGRRTVSASVMVIISLVEPPAITITSPPNGAVVTEGNSIIIRSSAADPRDGTLHNQVCKDGSVVLGTGDSIQVVLSQLGNHAITCAATNSGGLTASASVVVIVNDVPAIAIARPRDRFSYRTGKTVYDSAAVSNTIGSTFVVWKIVDQVVATGASASFTATLGEHQLVATVTDSYGATASDTVTVIVNNSRKILFWSYENGDNDLYQVDEDGTNLINLTQSTFDEGGPVFSPDGRYIAFTSNESSCPLQTSVTWVMEFDGFNRRQVSGFDASGQCLPVSQVVAQGASGFSPDGQWLALTVFSTEPNNSPHSDIAVLRVDRTGFRRVTSVNCWMSNPPTFPCWAAFWGSKFSPDGQKILATGQLYLGFSNWIDVPVEMNLDGSGLSRLNQDLDHTFNGMALSPDGTILALVGSRLSPDVGTSVWLVNRDGTNLRAVTPEVPYGEGVETVSFSQDGTALVYNAFRQGAPNEIRISDLSGTILRTLSFASVPRLSQPSFQP